MANAGATDGRTPLGHRWLRRRFSQRTTLIYADSRAIPGARRTEVTGARTVELYPRAYAAGEDVVANLRVALRYEPPDLGGTSIDPRRFMSQIMLAQYTRDVGIPDRCPAIVRIRRDMSPGSRRASDSRSASSVLLLPPKGLTDPRGWKLQ
jgi:hypothetical protein